MKDLEQQDKYLGLNLSQTLTVNKGQSNQSSFNHGADAPDGTGNPLSPEDGHELQPPGTLNQAIDADDNADRLSTILSQGILKSNLSNSALVEQDRLKCIAQQEGLLATQKELEIELGPQPPPTQAPGYSQKKSVFA